MKYKLTESAKYKYQWAMLAVIVIANFAVLGLQGMGVM